MGVFKSDSNVRRPTLESHERSDSNQRQWCDSFSSPPPWLTLFELLTIRDHLLELFIYKHTHTGLWMQHCTIPSELYSSCFGWGKVWTLTLVCLSWDWVLICRVCVCIRKKWKVHVYVLKFESSDISVKWILIVWHCSLFFRETSTIFNDWLRIKRF